MAFALRGPHSHTLFFFHCAWRALFKPLFFIMACVLPYLRVWVLKWRVKTGGGGGAGPPATRKRERFLCGEGGDAQRRERRREKQHTTNLTNTLASPTFSPSPSPPPSTHPPWPVSLHCVPSSCWRRWAALRVSRLETVGGTARRTSVLGRQQWGTRVGVARGARSPRRPCPHPPLGVVWCRRGVRGQKNCGGSGGGGGGEAAAMRSRRARRPARRQVGQARASQQQNAHPTPRPLPPFPILPSRLRR